MCGICGVITHQNRPLEPDSLWQAVERLAHRGPDDRDVKVFDAVSGAKVGFGHTRLSIIDLSETGHQPMANSDNSVWITYNGELYNYKALRDELSPRYRFRSQSDTEVIIHAYGEWGEECVRRFNGIFAFAIYDAKRGRVFAARDQIGVKPFYYYSDDQRFVFASEIKALFELGVRPLAARENIAEFLMYGWLADHRTLFKDISSLEPGHCLSVDLRDISRVIVTRYYDPRDCVKREKHAEWDRASDHDVVDKCSTLLESSVSGQMISDVPVGTLCSGGVDSSLVTAIALKHNPQLAIFNVSVSDNDELNEEAYARQVARHLGIEFNYFKLDRKQFRSALVETIYHSDFPLYNLNAVPVFYISQVAREAGVKVLLAGEGGDELFGGYEWRYARLFRNVRARRRWGHWIARVLNRTSDLAYVTRDDLFLPHFRTTTDDAANALRFASGFFGRGARFKESLAAYSFVGSPEERYAQAAMLSDVREYLEHLLNREDKSAMQASVECRVPFLDPDVVEFALNLPFRFKVRNGEGKWVVKKLAERYLPREIIYRRKLGFNLPAREYLDFSDEIFEGGFWDEEFGIDRRRIAEECSNGGESFWYGFLMTEIWGRLFLRGETPAEINQVLKV
jgi:asparagine synthase (glutamine-hydrolysing)